MPKNLDKQIFKLFKPARQVKLSGLERGLMTFNFKLNFWLKDFGQWFALPAKTPRFLLAVATSLVLLLFVGGGVWALERTQPGDFFYPAKQKLNAVVAKVIKPKVAEVVTSPEPSPQEKIEEKKQEGIKSSPVIEEKAQPAEAAVEKKEEKAAEKAEEKIDKAVEKVDEVTPQVALPNLPLGL